MKLLDMLHLLTALYFIYTYSINYFIHNNITTSKTKIFAFTTSTTASITQPKNSESTSTKNNTKIGLSGCLLIKDENHNLIEWLSYHYHILPLKHLVIAIDPNSQTLPYNILQRWTTTPLTNTTTNNQIHRINIKIWNDSDFFVKRWSGKLPWNATSNEHIHRHRMRQAMFITKCLSHHKKHGRNWVILIDTDEYLTFNPVTKDDLIDKHNDKKSNFHMVSGDDGTKGDDGMLDLLLLDKGKFIYTPTSNDMVTTFETSYNDESYQDQLLQQRTNILSPHEVYKYNITIEDYLYQHSNDEPWKSQSCVLIARTLFSAVEEENDDILSYKIPYDFNPLDFNTLRFFRHGGLNNIHRNRMGKAILDISRIPYSQLRGRASSPHIPIASLCNGNFYNHLSMLRVHHYSGTYESFMSKSDKRRIDRMYVGRSQANRAVTYDLKLWLDGFVNSVGYDEAKRLLDGVGKVVMNRHPDDLK